MNKIRHIINYGGGTQSTALILAGLEGLLDVKPDFAVFSDTGGEPDWVMDYVDMFKKYVKEKYDFEIFITTGGDLEEHIKTGYKVSAKSGNVYLNKTPPIMVKTNKGQIAPLRRSCTVDFKIKPLEKFIKQAVNIKEEKVCQWLGISFDEQQRVRISQEKWRDFRYPLIELKWKRLDSINYILSFGLPEPQRSACYFCPFHSWEYWKRLKQFEPDYFVKACELENILQTKLNGESFLRGKPYLNRWGINLDEIDFDQQLKLDFPDLIDECYGMCGT